MPPTQAFPPPHIIAFHAAATSLWLDWQEALHGCSVTPSGIKMFAPTQPGFAGEIGIRHARIGGAAPTFCQHATHASEGVETLVEPLGLEG